MLTVYILYQLIAKDPYVKPGNLFNINNILIFVTACYYLVFFVLLSLKPIIKN